MYLQIRKYRIKSGSAEELCRQAADQFLPIVKKVSGFVDYMIVDSHDGNVMSVSICEDRTGIDETNQRARQWHAQYAKQLEGPMGIMEGEIVVDATGFLPGKKPRSAA